MINIIRLPKKKKPRITAFGGGTGLSILLEGLSEYYPYAIEKINAVVAISDNGGSTGKLRKEYNLPAPGDIRKSLVALSTHRNLLKKLFEYRFTNSDSDLNGHSLGNLILTALWDITGSFGKAVRYSSMLLNTKGTVIPLTEDPATLVAEFNNGVKIHGEVNIYRYGKLQKGKIKRIWLEPQDVTPNPVVIEAIKESDVLIFGPGSLYTSIVASFLLEPVKKAIKESKAQKIYIANLLTDYGETHGLDAYDHLINLEKHLGKNLIDVTIINTAKIPSSVAKIYARKEGSKPVKPALKRFKQNNRSFITGNFITIEEHPNNPRIRHNATEVTKKILKYINKNK